MFKNKYLYLVPIGLLVGLYLLYRYFLGDKRVPVISANGKTYLVIPGYDQQRKADLLAVVDSRTQTLLGALGMSKPLEISENDDFSEFKAFTLNKDDIRLCLKTQDINTLMFVAMHELSHAFCRDTGHTDEFWNLFSTMIQKAISLGLYEYQDFQRTPEAYCGDTISSTPFTCRSCKVYHNKT